MLTRSRTDHDDAAAALHMLQSCLRRDQCSADIDVNHPVQFLQRGFLESLWNGRAGIINKHIKSAEGPDYLFDRGFDGTGISGVRLNRSEEHTSELQSRVDLVCRL